MILFLGTTKLANQFVKSITGSLVNMLSCNNKAVSKTHNLFTRQLVNSKLVNLITQSLSTYNVISPEPKQRWCCSS